MDCTRSAHEKILVTDISGYDHQRDLLLHRLPDGAV